MNDINDEFYKELNYLTNYFLCYHCLFDIKLFNHLHILVTAFFLYYGLNLVNVLQKEIFLFSFLYFSNDHKT